MELWGVTRLAVLTYTLNGFHQALLFHWIDLILFLRWLYNFVEVCDSLSHLYWRAILLSDGDCLLFRLYLVGVLILLDLDHALVNSPD